MSEELKPCPFCGGEATTTKKGPIRNQWWEVVCVSGECDTASITGDTEKAAIAAWNTRADLLPAVKPLVWEDFGDRGSKSYVFGRACYLIIKWSNGRFELCESYPGYQGERIGEGFFDTMKAAKAAAQADYEARIRACLDMIDPAELVAGAYEAAVQLVSRQVDGPMMIGLSQDIRAIDIAALAEGDE